MSRVFTPRDRSLRPSLRKKKKSKWRFRGVISTSIYTHDEVNPHYHGDANMSRHVERSLTKSHFLSLDYDVFFHFIKGVN